jgi:hypothetical protein
VKATHLIAVIEAIGGAVSLSPDCKHIRCRLPRGWDDLLKDVREERGELITLLSGTGSTQSGQQEASSHGQDLKLVSSPSDLIDRWLNANCAINSYCFSNPHALYRAFRSLTNSPTCPTEPEFLDRLFALGFVKDGERMIPGLVLAVDLEAAQEYEQNGTSSIDGQTRISDKEGQMPLIVSRKTKRYELPDEGEHLAVLADVIDLGEANTAKDKKPRIRFVWLLEQRDSEGKHIAVWVSYPNSLYLKSHLCKTVTTLLGRDPGDRFDLETLLGKNARVLIRHSEGNGRVFADIVETLKPRKSDHGFQLPPDFARASSNNGKNGESQATRNQRVILTRSRPRICQIPPTIQNNRLCQ